MNLDAVWVILNALAVHRIARLIVADTILDPPRAWLLSRWPGADTEFTAEAVAITDQGEPIVDMGDPDGRRGAPLVRMDTDTWIAANPRWFGRWLECVWCVSVWVAPVVVWLMATQASWWQYPAAALAFSAVAGWVHFYTAE